jgi:hypothetical protein
MNCDTEKENNSQSKEHALLFVSENNGLNNRNFLSFIDNEITPEYWTQKHMNATSVS